MISWLPNTQQLHCIYGVHPGELSNDLGNRSVEKQLTLYFHFHMKKSKNKS